MKMECNKDGIIAWHGTDRTDFASFDISRVAPYNVGFHFGTRAAALARIEYLHEHGRSRRAARLFKCRLNIRNPFRIDDVFGHTYAGILTALEDEIVSRESAGGAKLMKSPLRTEITALLNEYMLADDDPVLSRHGKAYLAYCHRLDTDIIRLFQSLGYDGFVYANEIEGENGAADSYVVFDVNQVVVLGAETIPMRICPSAAA